MTTEQLIGLWANIPRLRAKKILEELEIKQGAMSADRLHDLMLTAGRSKEDAEKAARHYMAAELRSGQIPSES